MFLQCMFVVPDWLDMCIPHHHATSRKKMVLQCVVIVTMVLITLVVVTVVIVRVGVVVIVMLTVVI